MITVSEAKILRERFYEGDLTQAEVAQLAEFMLSAHCPEAWRAERAVFAALTRPAPLPEGFAERLQTHVAATVAAPGRAPQALRPVHRRRSWLVAGLSAAACAAVALWLGLRTEVVYPDQAERTAVAQMQLPPSPKAAEAHAQPARSEQIPVSTNGKETKKARKRSSKKRLRGQENLSHGKEKQVGFSADRTAFPADRERDMVDATDVSVPAPGDLARRQAELAVRRAELAQMQAAMWEKQADLALRNALLVAAFRMPQPAQAGLAAEVPPYEPTAQTPAEQQAELCQVAALMHEVRAEYATALASRLLLLPKVSVEGDGLENEISHPQ